MKKIRLCSLIWLTIIPGSAWSQAMVSGYVFSLENGAPVPGAIITLSNQHGLALAGVESVYTDGSGFFRFDGLRKGRYIVRIGSTAEAAGKQTGYVLVSRPLAVDSSRTLYVGFRGGDVKMQMERRSRTDLDSEAEAHFMRWRLLRSRILDEHGNDVLLATSIEHLEE